MLFNSVSFAIFLPIVFIAYWLVPKKWQWFVILISSYYFYMSWEAKYAILMYIPTGVYRLHGVLEPASRKVRTTFTETEPMQI